MVENLYNDRLYTKKEFEEYLGQICERKKVAVSYILTDSLGNQYTYGQREEQEASQVKKMSLGNRYGVKIEVWDNGSKVEIGDYEKIFQIYWNNEYSDKTTGFPTTEQSLMLNKCNNTLKYYYENSQKVALIMIDLDHFKEVNDNSNHDVGSRVLGEFSQLLFSFFADYGIMIHQTGDEFNIIFPYSNMADIVNIVDIVKQARDKIETHSFTDAQGIKLSMAVGIKCIENESLDYISARNMAEIIYSNSNRKNSSKQRDSIRIDGIGNASYGPMDLKLAWTRMICNLDCAISGNVYLEFIKKFSEHNSEIKEFQNQIGDILDWINPEWDTTNTNIRFTSKNIMMDTAEKFSKLELCLAITQGLLKNPYLLKNKIFFKSQNNRLEVYVDEKIIFECANDSSVENFEGNCINYYRENCNKKCKRVLLVQAGYDDYSIPEDVFYKVIRVDTRPTTGGGLPDFWAATMCELITIMKDNPIVSDILIFGKVQYTRNIIELLDSIKEWESNEKYNFKYIAQKTFKSIEDIRKFKDKFQERIYKCNDNTELFNKVYQIYNSEIEEKIEYNVTKSIFKRRILERNLSYEGIALDICDGCRVKTIADAYPIVLEILRHQKKQKQYNIKDQAGRELLELTDFKIILSTPNSDDLPDYYAYDKQLLQEYYNKILGKENSLFRKKLMEKGQLESLIKHVVQAIKGKNNYATRRAVLIVPNVVEDEDNYSPLGLISIWLAPRFVENGVVVDFSYNWRTVEAVVGLPLSMYASVKFAEEIINLIKEKVISCNYSIVMGSVSYIAHSLHMFLDTESMDIARGIINDASI